MLDDDAVTKMNIEKLKHLNDEKKEIKVDFYGFFFIFSFKCPGGEFLSDR